VRSLPTRRCTNVQGTTPRDAGAESDQTV